MAARGYILTLLLVNLPSFQNARHSHLQNRGIDYHFDDGCMPAGRIGGHWQLRKVLVRNRPVIWFALRHGALYDVNKSILLKVRDGELHSHNAGGSLAEPELGSMFT